MRSRAQISSQPIHPILVTFPIGLFITSLVFDAIAVNRNLPSLWAAAWYCILAGNIMAVLAAIAGTIAYFTFIPAIIFLLVAPYKENNYVRFHAWQSFFSGFRSARRTRHAVPRTRYRG